MPNWVYNTLTIQGPKQQIDVVKYQLNQPFRMISDNWNIETQQMEIKEIVYSNPVFAFYNIHNHRQDGITDEEYVKQPASAGVSVDDPEWWAKTQEVAAVDNSWYNWNVRNWGTKWDVAVQDGDEYPETELLEHMSNGEDQWLVYRFNTAWSPPYPIVEKLSEMFPNCVITLTFQEETGWGGETEFVKGEVTAESDYESQCRDCEAENTMEYCDNDCGEICSACNWLGEADLECVAECPTHKVYLDDDHVPEYRRV